MSTLGAIALAYLAMGMTLGMLLACAAAMGGRADRALEGTPPVSVLRPVPDGMREAHAPTRHPDARTGVCPDCLLMVEVIAVDERCPVCDVRLAFPPHVATGPLGPNLHALKPAG
jgi:hypothetical protein